MLKQIFFLIISMVIILAFIGCSSQSPNIPDPPSNLWFSYGTDDLEIFLHWQQSPSQSIDGYKIYFDNEMVGSVPADSMIFSDYPQFLGTYSVVAYVGESESQRISIELPQPFGGSNITLTARDLCAYRFAQGNPSLMRKSIIVCSGVQIFYGDSSNQYLADSIDFYIDTTLTMRSPQKIVQEGRWTNAFYTRFFRVASNADSQVLDTVSSIPNYDDSLFSDSLVVHSEDLIAIVCFQNNEPSISADKRYVIIYITSASNEEHNESITFSYLAQSDKNYRLVKTEQ